MSELEHSTVCAAALSLSCLTGSGLPLGPAKREFKHGPFRLTWRRRSAQSVRSRAAEQAEQARRDEVEAAEQAGRDYERLISSKQASLPEEGASGWS